MIQIKTTSLCALIKRAVRVSVKALMFLMPRISFLDDRTISFFLPQEFLFLALDFFLAFRKKIRVARKKILRHEKNVLPLRHKKKCFAT